MGKTIQIENQKSRHLLVYREVWNTTSGKEPKQEKDEAADVYLARRQKVDSFRLTLGSTMDDNKEVDAHNAEVRKDADGEPDPRDVIPLPAVGAPSWAIEKLKGLSAPYRNDLKNGVIRELRAA